MHYITMDTPCIIQTDGRDMESGYAMIGKKPAYKVLYKSLHGDVPKGYHIHHICRNKLCVNVDHLHAIPGHLHTQLHKHEDQGIGGRPTLPKQKRVWS